MLIIDPLRCTRGSDGSLWPSPSLQDGTDLDEAERLLADAGAAQA